MGNMRLDLPEQDDSRWLDEEDIAELDELLNSLQNQDHLRLDAAQGLVAAVAVSPEQVDIDSWLPAIVGVSPTLDDNEQAQRLVELLLRLKQVSEYSISHYCFEPIFAERHEDNGEIMVDASGWCMGFSMGVDLLADRWEAQMQQDEELIELLSPIMALGVDDGAFADVYDQQIGPLSESEREYYLQKIPGLLSDVQQYWDDHVLTPTMPNLNLSGSLH